ncbi:hypothetical protein NE237_014870 [Protea cynaroides]|uniref:Uncharacterized protein n=1 Tax=Protea cynaroides TaxID=273540 RepID=A0A9Q0KD32_9MAGN|nr:hypothetical protein NE237_014870 [Protea cynaroides]
MAFIIIIRFRVHLFKIFPLSTTFFWFYLYHIFQRRDLKQFDILELNLVSIVAIQFWIQFLLLSYDFDERTNYEFSMLQVRIEIEFALCGCSAVPCLIRALQPCLDFGDSQLSCFDFM